MLESHSLDMKHEERMEEIHRQYSLDIKNLIILQSNSFLA